MAGIQSSNTVFKTLPPSGGVGRVDQPFIFIDFLTPSQMKGWATAAWKSLTSLRGPNGTLSLADLFGGIGRLLRLSIVIGGMKCGT
jgi:hypothetical protein